MAPAIISIILLVLVCGGKVSSQSDPDPVPITDEGVKPGKCPIFRFLDICEEAPSEPFCTGDETCLGDKKCCKDVCGIALCVTPLPRVKPGTCPELSVPELCPRSLHDPECSADDECPGGKKCCKDSCGEVKCTNPIAEQKPGICPNDNVACDPPLPPPDCYNDLWCSQDQKCCYYFCQLQCVNHDALSEE